MANINESALNDLALNDLIEQKIREAVERRGIPPQPTKQDSNEIDRLTHLCNELHDKAYFTTGDIVVWKDGLKNKNYPEYGQPAIVLRRLDNPIVNPVEDSGSTYFNEPLDIVLGLISRDEDDAFLVFYYDSRRFKLLKQ